MKGTVEAISHKNRSVLLSDGQTKRWLNLANNVKPEYIKKGPAEFEIENDTVKFIKASELPERTKKAIDESNINRVASLKFAGNIYQGTGDEDQECGQGDPRDSARRAAFGRLSEAHVLGHEGAERICQGAS